MAAGPTFLDSIRAKIGDTAIPELVDKVRVEAAEVGGKVFLPFAGDNLLSIILSKAFLLAEDSKIKDPTIVSQIQRR